MYNKRPVEILEVSCYVNLTLLCLVAIFVLENENAKAAVSNTSVSVTFILFLGVLCYHVYTELIAKTKRWRKYIINKYPGTLQQESEILVEESKSTETFIPTISVIGKPKQLLSICEPADKIIPLFHCDLREPLLEENI